MKMEFTGKAPAVIRARRAKPSRSPLLLVGLSGIVIAVISGGLPPLWDWISAAVAAFGLWQTVSAYRFPPKYLRPTAIPYDWLITDVGVTQTTDHCMRTMDWAAFEGLRVRRAGYVLRVQGGTVLAIPREPLTPEQDAELAAFLKARTFSR